MSALIRNVFEMLAYAFKAIDSVEHRMLTSEEFEDADELLAAILSVGLSEQIKRGLEHDYVTFEEDARTPRGHIDMTGTARLKAARRTQIRCLHDDYSIDTLKNRILATAGRLAIASASHGRRVHASVHHHDYVLSLRRSLAVLKDIPDITNLRSIDWNRLRYHRNNGSYQLLMGVCSMILDRHMQTMENGGDHAAIFSWEQDLPWIYEHFILQYFAVHHPDISAKAEIIRNGLDANAPAWLPKLQTDITLRKAKRTLIIDAKCYGRILKSGRFGNPLLAPTNRNQIYSYVMHAAYGSSFPVAGMLLYAQTDVDEPMRSNWMETGHEFYAWTLNLNQPFTAISSALDEIAERILPGR